MRKMTILLALVIAAGLLAAACTNDSTQPQLVNQSTQDPDKRPPAVPAIPQDFLNEVMNDYENIADWTQVKFEDMATYVPQTKQPDNFVLGETMTLEKTQPGGGGLADSVTAIIWTPTYDTSIHGNGLLFRAQLPEASGQYKIDTWFPEWLDGLEAYGNHFTMYEIWRSELTGQVYIANFQHIILQEDGAPVVTYLWADPEKDDLLAHYIDPGEPGDD